MTPGVERVSLARHLRFPNGPEAIYLCQHANRSKVTGWRDAAAAAGGWPARHAANLPVEHVSEEEFALRPMTNLYLAASGAVIGIGYAIDVLIIIVLVDVAVVKLFGRSPETRWHKRGAVGAGEDSRSRRRDPAHLRHQVVAGARLGFVARVRPTLRRRRRGGW